MKGLKENIFDRVTSTKLFEQYALNKDIETRNRLIVINERLLRLSAERYFGCGEPLEDLTQVGVEGLIKAINNFDLGKGTRFSTFAVPCIRKSIFHYLRDQCGTIHVPRYIQEFAIRIRRCIKEMSIDFNRIPTDYELAIALDTTEEIIVRTMREEKLRQLDSLDYDYYNKGEKTCRLSDTVGYEDESIMEMIESITIKPLYEALYDALSHLDKPTIAIIRMKILEGKSYREISEILRISKWNVAFKLKKAIGFLKTEIPEELVFN